MTGAGAQGGAPGSDRRVLVGVTGGIAIYKAVELVRGLAREGFAATVVTTAAARRFVTPLTFAAVSRGPVLDDESAWQSTGGWFEHIDAAREADVMVVAPATANTLAKMAAGIADNLLTAVYLAFRGPVIVAPTMNWAMYEHPATQENLRRLAGRGVEVLPTGRGELACGEEGLGRMAEPEAILAAVRRAFAVAAEGPLCGRRVVVTAGGTRERIDAVRYVGNRSSGKMGRALADEAYLRGAEVTLVATHAVEGAPYTTVPVESAEEMAAAVRESTAAADVLVMAAAVADFRPREAEPGKIERGQRETLGLELERTVDVLAAAARPGLLRVAFAAEAGPRIDRAREKKAAKGVDLLVFNDVLAEGVGIGADENEITILTGDREIHVSRRDKRACAAAVLDAVEEALP
ncbi:MAG: bifunctional phosphopantothenoylcysteine decarboxylase/phosphopantothenate--cysteine ligase CoaBC [Thermoleophilia bacterium]|nr:bifunctional phosphopantothenoylcysteine decarboxylase/phosphopantothenate--cysteine ligase CoaBC [Thermoleophilia bacterium]